MIESRRCSSNHNNPLTDKRLEADPVHWQMGRPGQTEEISKAKGVKVTCAGFGKPPDKTSSSSPVHHDESNPHLGQLLITKSFIEAFAPFCTTCLCLEEPSNISNLDGSFATSGSSHCVRARKRILNLASC